MIIIRLYFIWMRFLLLRSLTLSAIFLFSWPFAWFVCYKVVRRTFLILFSLMLLYGWSTEEFMTLELVCFALCICVICFYASGYKENFPEGTIKMNWNWEDQSADRSSGEQGFSSSLKVPGGVFTVNKQLSVFLTKPHCVYSILMYFLPDKHLQSSFCGSSYSTLACSYVLILLFLICRQTLILHHH